MVVTPSSRIGNFERAAQLAAAIADAGTCFIADVETLRATAFELARLDAELRACETALSRPRGPSAVELAVQVLLAAWQSCVRSCPSRLLRAPMRPPLCSQVVRRARGRLREPGKPQLERPEGGKVSEQAREARLRRVARRGGLKLQKSRSRTPQAFGYGTYQLIDPYTSMLVAADWNFGFGLSLDDIEDELTRLGQR